MKCRYSGNSSKKLWNRIRRCDNKDGSLYELGCILQSVEYRFLKTLEKFELRKEMKTRKK